MFEILEILKYVGKLIGIAILGFCTGVGVVAVWLWVVEAGGGW